MHFANSFELRAGYSYFFTGDWSDVTADIVWAIAFSHWESVKEEKSIVESFYVIVSSRWAFTKNN